MEDKTFVLRDTVSLFFKRSGRSKYIISFLFHNSFDLFLPFPAVICLVDFLEFRVGEVGVNLGGGDIGVAEHLLN